MLKVIFSIGLFRKYDFQISQGSEETLFRWDRQHYKNTRGYE